jgi:hypothetical protein
MANVFNELGQRILPKVFGKLSGVGLTDLMDVKGETVTSGTGGGRIKSASTTVYSNIPVIFKPKETGVRMMQAERLTSEQEYILTFPSHTAAGVRYAIDPKVHRLQIKARTAPGTEPAKTFRIVSIKDLQGNLYEAEAIREDIQ